jgi:hypothetical protein
MTKPISLSAILQTRLKIDKPLEMLKTGDIGGHTPQIFLMKGK